MLKKYDQLLAAARKVCMDLAEDNDHTELLATLRARVNEAGSLAQRALRIIDENKARHGEAWADSAYLVLGRSEARELEVHPGMFMQQSGRVFIRHRKHKLFVLFVPVQSCLCVGRTTVGGTNV
jgi:hypothetical protein